MKKKTKIQFSLLRRFAPLLPPIFNHFRRIVAQCFGALWHIVALLERLLIMAHRRASMQPRAVAHSGALSRKYLYTERLLTMAHRRASMKHRAVAHYGALSRKFRWNLKQNGAVTQLLLT